MFKLKVKRIRRNWRLLGKHLCVRALSFFLFQNTEKERKKGRKEIHASVHGGGEEE